MYLRDDFQNLTARMSVYYEGFRRRSEEDTKNNQEAKELQPHVCLCCVEFVLNIT